MRLRVTLAMAAVALSSAAILFAAHLVFDRPALRLDLEMLATSKLAIELLSVVALAVAATIIAVGRGESGLGPSVTSLLLVALLVTPLYALLTVAGRLEVSESAVASRLELSPWGLRCLAIAAAVGVLALLSFAAALRRSAPVASRLRGAAVGATAGAWAGVSVFFFCPAIEPGHLVVGHVLPIAALTVLGLAAIPRVLRP